MTSTFGQNTPQAMDEGDTTMAQPAPSEGTEAPGVGDDNNEATGSGDAASSTLASNDNDTQHRRQEFFHVIRKSDYLEAPVLFLSFNDFNLYMENLQEASASSPPNTTIEHKQFDMLMDAVEYMFGDKEIISQKEIRRSQVNVPINNNPKSIRLTTEQGPRTTDTANPNRGPTLTSTDASSPNESTNTQLSSAELPQAAAASPTAVEAASAATASPENDENDKTRAPSKKRSRSTTTTQKSQRKSNPAKKKQSYTPGQRKRMDKFETFFRLLLQYKSEFGACDVPTENKHLAVGKYSGLGQWYVRKYQSKNGSVKNRCFGIAWSL